MKVIVLNDNNSIDNIIKGIEGGKPRQCVLSNENIERLSPIIRYAHKLHTAGKDTFIQVKFDSAYNARPKRLEIVAKDGNVIEVYKFAKKSTFEKECIETQRVLDELKSIYSNCFKGFIIIQSLQGDLDLIKERMCEISSDVSIILE